MADKAFCKAINYSERFPATQIIDGERCPLHYDSYYYRRRRKVVSERGDIIEVILNPFEFAHCEIIISFILQK